MHWEDRDKNLPRQHTWILWTIPCKHSSCRVIASHGGCLSTSLRQNHCSSLALGKRGGTSWMAGIYLHCSIWKGHACSLLECLTKILGSSLGNKTTSPIIFPPFFWWLRLNITNLGSFSHERQDLNVNICQNSEADISVHKLLPYTLWWQSTTKSFLLKKKKKKNRTL